MPRLILALWLILTAFVAGAQERPRTILVLDGSGSMWGQIDGVNKIVIARDVIGTILQDFPPDQELGLTVYGHRRKGDCNDIETVIAPGTGTVDPIIGAVNAINPKGKTPLSAAVMAAAEALRFTEERATVILVSDGIETCDIDPCAVGRQLEELGVDFTAHVVGFDVEDDPQARAQLQCLAEETGGIFRTASSASELTDALQVVAEPPAPGPVEVTFVATEGEGGPRIVEDLQWFVSSALAVPVLPGVTEASPVAELLPGAYSVTVARGADAARATVDFEVGEEAQTVTVALPELVRSVDVTFRVTEGEGGPPVIDGLTWSMANPLGVPLMSGPIIGVPRRDLEPGAYTVSVTREEDGASAEATFNVARTDMTVTLVLPEIVRPQAVTLLAKVNGANFTAGLEWEVHDADGNRVLRETVDGTPTTELMPGSYTAKVLRVSDGATAERGFTVADTAQTVILNLPDLPPEPVSVRIFATDGKNGPRITDDLVWDLTGPDGAILTSEQTPNLSLELTEGTYTVSVLRPVDESFAELRFGVGSEPKTLDLVLPEFRPLATVSAPASAPMGSLVQVEWTGPNAKDDYISVSAPESDEGAWLHYTYTREGPLLEVRMPPREGPFEIRYVLNDGRKVLASTTIDSTPVTASVTPGGTFVAGAAIPVDWTGPDYKDDYIAILLPGENRWQEYTHTREGSPLDLQLPSEPGDYEVAYVMQQGETVLARSAISVSDVTATVSGPPEALAGAEIEVDWTGPDYKDDYIAILKPGEDRWQTYTYTREGSPLDLKLPNEPGDYELAYVMQHDGRVLARAAISIGDVAATVSAPAEAPAGSSVRVDWTGPAYAKDYIAVTARDGDRWLTYSYVEEGSPLDLALPAEPGAYDIVYAMQQGGKILARTRIAVTDIAATLTPPAELTAGATVDVGWTGPDYKDDFIAVVARGEEGWINYAYTRDGSPAALQLPGEPGEYDLTYVMRQGGRELARVPITVSALDAAVSAPASAPAGSEVQVTWTGPDYRSDFIAVVEEGGAEGSWIGYTYTSKGNPATLAMPPAPGTYEIRYVLNQDRLTMARTTIEVTAVEATVSGPATAVAGSDIKVEWTGPGYRNDLIALAPAGAGDGEWVAYEYARGDSPATLTLPVKEGDFELRYVMAQGGRTLLASVPITLTPVTATLDAPATAPAGGTLSVDWTGPDYRGDFIGIGAPGARHSDYAYTRNGSPAMLDLPDTPGTYELRYIVGQGQTVIHTRTVTLE